MKMNHKDALHILGLNYNDFLQDKEANQGAIIAAYRLSCKKYHPDRNPAGLEMMKLVNVAYESLQDYLNDKADLDKSIKFEKAGTENYGEAINAALNAIINLGLEIEICGSWIWVSGDTRPHRETLKNAGFKWAPKKAMWHFRPAEYKSFNRGKWDIATIRLRHGSQTIKPKAYQQIEG